MDNRLSKVLNTTYALADFFPDTDPLKNKLKERILIVLEVLADLSALHSNVSIDSHIKIIQQYLNLARSQRWIDGVTFLALTKEYDDCKNNVPLLAVQEKHPLPSNTWTSSVHGTQDDISSRQRKIMDILSRKEKAQVADIIVEIPQVTKRTLRRDLDDLLQKGKIIRNGEWNQVMYSINRDRT